MGLSPAVVEFYMVVELSGNKLYPRFQVKQIIVLSTFTCDLHKIKQKFLPAKPQK